MLEAHYCASKLNNATEACGSAFCETWLDDSWLMIRAGNDLGYDSDYLGDLFDKIQQITAVDCYFLEPFFEPFRVSMV